MTEYDGYGFPYERTVILQPLTFDWIAECYVPSRLQQPKKISYDDFIEYYADSACSVYGQTIYAYGLDCWYTIGDDDD